MRRKRNEIWALAFLTAGVLLFAALVSFRASDCTFFNVSSRNCPTNNWIGFVGANISWCLFFFLGIGAYVFPALAFWFSYRSFRKQEVLPYGKVQVLGIILSLLSFITLAILVIPQVRHFGDPIVTGGQLGLFIAHYLKGWFNLFGTYVLVTGIFLIGLLLATPFSLRSTSRRLLGLCSACLDLFWKITAAATSPWKHRFGRRVSPQSRKKLKTIVRQPKIKTLPAPSPQASAGSKRSTTPHRYKKPIVSSHAYQLPSLDLLDVHEVKEAPPDLKSLERNARLLEQKLADFGVQGEVIDIQPGPVITMYEYAPAPGIKISRIVSLADDLAMALRAISLRVVAPIPGKAAIGIELPNAHRAMVSIRSVLESQAFLSCREPLAVAFGKDITGQPVVADLAKMPHLLIAGATGTGKSVCINVMLTSLLYRNTPEEMRLLLIDPKRIELSTYEGIPHLLHPVITDVKMATRGLRWAVKEMELRYRLIAEKNVRNIESYNKLMIRQAARRESKQPPSEESGLPHRYLPLIVIIIDELADLMMVASREVEEYIMRLAQMARAAGIHLILATQRPSVDVLTGVIKANIPTRLSFQVSSRVDSRTVLDTIGAETLLGAGDMLFLPPGTAKLKRIHGAFITEEEVERVTQFWIDQKMPAVSPVQELDLREQSTGSDLTEEELDEKYDEAVELVLRTRQASISMLQRRLRVGYNRAARMIEVMEQQGIVGPSDGSKPREILLPPKE